MAYHRGLGAEAVYAAARRVVDAGLRTDGSVFTPEAAIWTLDRAEDL
jgi:5-methylcytosine-specific restriction enzyme B